MKVDFWRRSLPLTAREFSCVAVLCSLVLFSTVNATAQAPNASARASAEKLTLSLLSLHKQYQSTSPEGRTALAREMRNVAAQRQQLLSSLIQTNPAEVLQFAIPNEISGQMPAWVQTYLEQKVQAQGVLKVMVQDSISGSKLHHYLKSAAATLELKFAGNVPTDLF